MIVCDDDHLGLIDATAARNAFGRQLQSFEADLDDRGDRRRAAARGLHPRALGRAPRPRGRGARLLRGAPGGDARGQRARLRLPPRADRRLATARTVHGHDYQRAEPRAGGGGDVRDPRAENLAKILVGYSTEVKEGEVVSIDGESGAEPLLLRGLRGGAEGRRPPDPQRRPRGPGGAYYKHASDAQLEWISPLIGVDGRQRRRAHRASAPAPTRASSPAFRRSARRAARRRPASC